MKPYSRHRAFFATLICGVGIAALVTGCVDHGNGFDPHRNTGVWQQSITVVKMGVEDQLPAVAKSTIGVPTVSAPYCLNSQGVSTDTLESRLTDLAVLNAEWKMGPITVIDGDVNATATGPLGNITYSGKLSPQFSDITMTTAAGKTEQGQTTTIQRIRAEHIGPCTPDMVVMGQ